MNLCIAIWDEVTGAQSPLFTNYFYPGSYHAIDAALSNNIKKLMNTHRVIDVPVGPDTLVLHEGDMVIVRPQASGGPAHVLLLGTSLHECYHAERQRGVQVTSCPPRADIIRVLRKRTF